MECHRAYRWLAAVFVLFAALAAVQAVVLALGRDVKEGRADPADVSPSLAGRQGRAHVGEAVGTLASAEAAQVDVFTNTWSYSTIGMVYDFDREIVRYAHESQSSTRNPTVYDVERLTDVVGTPTVVLSFALSAENSGWPWQLDNRTGAGYDFVEKTYFIPDYNGDLSYADDNIVEIDADGKILNAWEMDDEVGSNDSSDGSEIDSIIDIAVVPGDRTRYFATAAYDDDVVYEIALTRTGNFWTPNSWRTVKVYTDATFISPQDNLGIDYDAQNGWLYHSSWDTTTILITDLTMQPVTEVSATFDCPGQGGYNTGVTYIEGSSPPKVWVTDFSSDQTTVCALEDEPVLDPGWTKTVSGTAWASPGVTVSTETSDTFQVSDVITGGLPFTLTERWNDEHLLLFDWAVDPPVADVLSSTGVLTVTGGDATPSAVTVTKSFLSRPCTWTVSTVSETLVVSNTVFDPRPFTVTKRAPTLTVASASKDEVVAGSVATFTLTYSNTGGFENDVSITSTFPVSAPFLYSIPAADHVSGDRLHTRWDIGGLSSSASGSISGFVAITDTGAMTFESGIYDHVGEKRKSATSTMTATDVIEGWEKWIDGTEWSPTYSATVQTSDTLTVVDVITPTAPRLFLLAEAWDPTRLRLKDWHLEPSSGFLTVTSYVSGLLTLEGTANTTVTLTKVFTVGTCSWSRTVLFEAFGTAGLDEELSLPALQPVLINKLAPDLYIEGSTEGAVVSGGDDVTFTLTYSNAGGFENAFRVETVFPEGVSFVSADPAPNVGTSGGVSVSWTFTDGLDMAEVGSIRVTANITEEVPPSATLSITSTTVGHDSIPYDEAVVTYFIPPPEWRRWVNGQPWRFGKPLPARVGDEVEVTDVVTGYSAVELQKAWDPDHLTLLGSAAASGVITTQPGTLVWKLSPAEAQGARLTTRFRVEAFGVPDGDRDRKLPGLPTEPSANLLGELVVAGVSYDKKPVRFTEDGSETVAVGGYSVARPKLGHGQVPGFVLLLILPLTGFAAAKAWAREQRQGGS